MCGYFIIVGGFLSFWPEGYRGEWAVLKIYHYHFEPYCCQVPCGLHVTLTIKIYQDSFLFLRYTSISLYNILFCLTAYLLSACWQSSNTANRYGLVLFHAPRHQLALSGRSSPWESQRRNWTSSWKGLFSCQTPSGRPLPRACTVSTFTARHVWSECSSERLRIILV